MTKTLVRALAATLLLASAAASYVTAQRSPRLLVLNKEDAAMVIVDPDSGAVLGKIGVGVQPHELVASTDGKTAFASNYDTGPAPRHTISIIAIPAQTHLRR